MADLQQVEAPLKLTPPSLFRSKRLSLYLLPIAFLVAAVLLPLRLGELIPSTAGHRVACEFFGAALSPAIDYEGGQIEGGISFPSKVVQASFTTLRFALLATACSLLIGLPLGILGSRLWSQSWDKAGRRARWMPALSRLTRCFQAMLRSVHELIWAMLFLAALGVSEAVAVVAVAIPYSGVLGKIFSEMIDESPTRAGEALLATGAGELRSFFFGVLPRVIPDLCSYVFYRFECALRSSAVLGFIGVGTLGLYIKQSFENAYYHEVWTYLYALLLMILIFDWSSSVLRRRLS